MNSKPCGSSTWANEPPSEAEQIRIRSERALLRAAASGNESEISSAYVNCIGSGKSRPLHLAAAAGSIGACLTLLNSGAEINAVNSLGFTALVVAVINKQKPVAELLIQKGADVKIKSKKGQGIREIGREWGVPWIDGLVGI